MAIVFSASNQHISASIGHFKAALCVDMAHFNVPQQLKETFSREWGTTSGWSHYNGMDLPLKPCTGFPERPAGALDELFVFDNPGGIENV